jgi:uncharacterized protein
MSGCGRWLQHTVRIAGMVTLLGLAACGFKDKPVPPQHAVPKAIDDLRVEIGDKGAILSWTYPKETVTGRDVDEIDGFELYRAEIPAQSYCATCPVPYSARVTVAGGSVSPGGGRTATFEVKDVRPGHVYVFMVRSRTGWWVESKDSNEVSFFWQTPPEVPHGLTVTAGDGANTLQWQPVTQKEGTVPSTAPMRYQVYRGVDGGVVAALGEPLATNSFSDQAVENGREYTYQVQTISTYAQGAVRSGLSESVQAKPMDRTAPSVPKKFEGLRTEIGVKLYWEHVESGDLAGYRIYRRAMGESKPTLVGEVQLPMNIFTDSKAPPALLFYSISSIDTQNPANESARSNEIRIEN